MKIKTSELTDAALDWAVCEAAGLLAAYPRARKDFALQWSGPGNGHLHPSTAWSQGGPIIEGGRINIRASGAGDWVASTHDVPHPYRVIRYGTTPLIAAMRCYVASKLGEEVEIPNELIGE